MPDNDGLKRQDTKFDDKEDECSEIEQTVAALIYKTFHSGPLPAPATLKEYNEILPNAAERIFQMAEKEQNHQHSLGIKLVESEIKKVSKGQDYAIIIALVGIVVL